MDFTKSIIKDEGFSNSQELMIKDFTEWWNTDNLIYTITGAAGTGKTYILNYLIRNVMKGKKIAVTAPTHKAVRVIEIMTGVKGRTIHSLHGLRPNTALETFNIDSVKYDSLGTIHIKNYEIVIIDECSQINAGLFKLNELRARQYNVRIIYVGDRFQLPPVKEKISLSFNQSHVFELTDIVRQEKGNPLLELLSIAREDVKNGKLTSIDYLKANPTNLDVEKDVGYIVLSDKDFANSCVSHFVSDEFSKDIDYCRYGAYTNDTILNWNKYVRSKIIPNNTEILDKNDVLLSYQNIVDANMNPIIINSEDYIIDDIYDRYSEHGFREFVVNLRAVTDGRPASVMIVDHLHLTFKYFYTVLNHLHEVAYYAHVNVRTQRWKEYYAFKNNHLVMIEFALIKPDGQSRGWVKKDIDYGYGCTIHKLQGSTIKNIFINIRDIVYYKKNNKYYRYTDFSKDYNDIMLKLIYTALSRASNKAIILL